MRNLLDILQERGFVQQVTDPDALRKALEERPVVGYIGFDPTNVSLHVGHLVQIMALAHLQRAGHHPIALVGGGTAMVGDPSGRTEIRQMLSPEQIEINLQSQKKQLAHYLDFDSTALMVNNADWLLALNYIEFLRTIGRHFSVNRMLAAEAYKARLETGLSFLEFNYQLLQAYDFLMLHQRYGCTLQLGGDDQWGNILAGVDLIRRIEGATAYGLTTPLLTTAGGQKMGKTVSGAVWLDKARLSPYHFYQYWINTDDRDVERFLALFTFLPLDEVRRLGQRQGAELQQAKEVLAFEVTSLAHGQTEAEEARATAQAIFGGKGEDLSAMPTTTIASERLEAGMLLTDLLAEVGLCRSKGESRRLIQQGGAYLNEERVIDIHLVLNSDCLQDGQLLLRAGKKRYHRVLVA